MPHLEVAIPQGDGASSHPDLLPAGLVAVHIVVLCSLPLAPTAIAHACFVLQAGRACQQLKVVLFSMNLQCFFLANPAQPVWSKLRWRYRAA
jgi:hypothetical protein